MNIMDSDPLPDSKDDIFRQRIICKSDTLTTEDETSNGEKSENEAQIEFLETSNYCKIHVESLPILQDVDVKASWTRHMTKALIEEYTIMLDYFRVPDRKQKDLWMQLASRMQAKGYQVSWEMCHRKFRNLKQTYRTIKYSDRTNKSKRRWEFYDDFKILIPPFSRNETNRQISPPSSPVSRENIDKTENASFLQVYPQNKSSTDESINESQQISQSSSTENDKMPPEWFKEFLIQLKAGQDSMLVNIRKMHNESKLLELRKIKLLENILSLMKNKN